MVVARVLLWSLMWAALMTSVNDFGLPTINIYLYPWTSKNIAKIQREWHYFLTSFLLHTSAMYACWETPDSCVRTRIYIFFRCCGSTRAMSSLCTRFPDKTQRLITVGRTPLDEWSARRRDLFLTTHNTHNRQISMPQVGFEPKFSAG